MFKLCKLTSVEVRVIEWPSYRLPNLSCAKFIECPSYRVSELLSVRVIALVREGRTYKI